MTNEPPTKVEFAPPFLRALKRLRKKYPNVKSDVQPLLEQLEGGQTPGDQMPGVGHAVYKVRLRSSDLTRGKSGGYRVIYYVRTAEQVILLLIYAKSEREDVSAGQIRRAIEEHEPPEG